MATSDVQNGQTSATLLIVTAIVVGTLKFFLDGTALFPALFVTFAIGFYVLRAPPKGAVFQRARSPWGRAFCTIYLSATFLAFFLLANGSATSFRDTFAVSFFSTDTVLFGLCVPFFEELFFRGGVQDVVERSVNRGTSSHKALWLVYLSALVFWIFHWPVAPSAWRYALSHYGIPVGPGPFLLGLCCAFIALKDRSLVWAMVFHGLCNVLGNFWQPALKLPWLVDLFYSR